MGTLPLRTGGGPLQPRHPSFYLYLAHKMEEVEKYLRNSNHFIGVTVYNNIGITDEEEIWHERTDKIGRIGHDGNLAAR